MIRASLELGLRWIVRGLLLYGRSGHNPLDFSRAGAWMVHVAVVLVQGFGLTWSTHFSQFPAVPGRHCWVLWTGPGSAALVPSVQVTWWEASREMQSLFFKRSKPLQAELHLMLWRALLFYRQILCTEATPVEQLQIHGLGFPETGGVRSKVSLASGQFILVFIISGICWQMLTVILGRQTLFWWLFYPYAKSS